MEQFKNILLGFLIALVLCLSYQLHTHQSRDHYNEDYTQHETDRRSERSDEMFDRFLDLIIELKKLENDKQI